MDEYASDVWVRKLRSRFSQLGLRPYKEESDYQIPSNDYQCFSQDDGSITSPLEEITSNENLSEIVENSQNSPATISNIDHQQTHNSGLDVEQLREKRLSYFNKKPVDNNLDSVCTNVMTTTDIQMSSVCNEQQNAKVDCEEREQLAEFYTRPKSAGEVSEWRKYNWQTNCTSSVISDDDDDISCMRRNMSNENIDLMLDWWGLQDMPVDSELNRYLPRYAQNIRSCKTYHHNQSDYKLITRESSVNDNMVQLDGIFPVGFDETELEMNKKFQLNNHGRLKQYSSDSDSDFTQDDPIIKPQKTFNLSPRVLVSPKGMVFEQTVKSCLTPSPPKPQIPGLLYHGFADEEMNNTTKILTNSDLHQPGDDDATAAWTSNINDKMLGQSKAEIPDYRTTNGYNEASKLTTKFNNTNLTMCDTTIKNNISVKSGFIDVCKKCGCDIDCSSNWCCECEQAPQRTLKTNNESEGISTDNHRARSNGKNRRWQKSGMAWNAHKDNHLSIPSFLKKNISRPRSSSYKGNVRHDNYSHDCVGSWPKTSKINEIRNKPKNYKKKSVVVDVVKGNKADVEKCPVKKNELAIDLSSLKIGDDHNETDKMKYRRYTEALPYFCLPDEIIMRIIGHLSNFDLARCSQVCKQLYRICQDEVLWKTIVLKKQNISDETLINIGSKKPIHLALIHCHGDSVTSAGLRELFRKCGDNLEELNFSFCSGSQLIGESILLHVALRCKKLKSVDASWSNVGDNGIEALVQNVDRLECICLNGCQAITDRSLKVIADKHGQSLRTFETFGCFNVSAGAIKQLGMKCPNLQTLSLGQCYKITSSAIGHVVSHLKSIVNLDLRGCKQAKDACVKTIAKHCPLLVNLVLANCQMISDVAMTEIANNLPSVRFLDVCGCFKVTDHGVKALAQSCNRLNYLDLSSTSITQKSVILLANYCSQNLKSLKLSFCVNVTNDSVTRLVKHCKRMTTLHLYGCKKLKNIEALQKFNKFLKLEF